MSTDGLSKILIFGGTGYIGKYMVKASVQLGHKTYIYSRPSIPLSNDHVSKLHILEEFRSIGVTIFHGELDEHEKLVSVLSQVDVISVLAYPQVLDQLKIIDAMKIAGNIKRFFPSDFGVEEDRVSPLKIRRAIKAAGIPYTFVSANCFGAYFVNFLLHRHDQLDHVTVYGTGEAKTVLNYEEDIAMYTIKLADDARAQNKIVIYRMEKNIISQLELISLWENKTGRTFKRVHVPEDDIVNLSKSLPHPGNIPVSIIHSLFIKGDTMNFKLGNHEVEASELYPDYKYATIDQLLDVFLVNPPLPAIAAFE
ncbi:hypothetical protein K2173_007149 [Erythroxylum novogranatense]|uniref:NmrA-like domain-containing protein n=1 Tax=Erythroxylum novogranatense TaxID=1862640 RepID=A0AAV8SYI1_9ROSI|nr:hypothetical protein K2173_007149 [Erythroxylum novogranatense]